MKVSVPLACDESTSGRRASMGCALQTNACDELLDHALSFGTTPSHTKVKLATAHECNRSGDVQKGEASPPRVFK